MRVGKRIKRAFDNRQQRQINRHAARLYLFNNVGQIATSPGEYALKVIGMGDVPAIFLIDTLFVGVGQTQPAAEIVEQVALLGGDRRRRERRYCITGGDLRD